MKSCRRVTARRSSSGEGEVGSRELAGSSVAGSELAAAIGCELRRSTMLLPHAGAPVRSCGRGYSALTAPAMSKIGMYMAISMKPTIPPMPTIMIGSIMAVSAPTATSTSSS